LACTAGKGRMARYTMQIIRDSTYSKEHIQINNMSINIKANRFARGKPAIEIP